MEALRNYGVAERDIITDKFSGKDFNRQGYLTLKEHILRAGDILVIKELDRLGRDYEQIKVEWQELQKMGVDIVIIDMPILNTAETAVICQLSTEEGQKTIMRFSGSLLIMKDYLASIPEDRISGDIIMERIITRT